MMVIRGVLLLFKGNRPLLGMLICVLGACNLRAQTNPVPGTVRWSFKTGDVIRSSAATDETGSVYFGGLDRYLYALDNKSGDRKSVV